MDKTKNVYGQIIDYSEKTPLIGAKIEYGKYKTTTDKDGDFTIRILEKDISKLIENKTYITISKKGYTTATIYPVNRDNIIKSELDTIELKSTTLQAEQEQTNAQLYTQEEKKILNQEINKKNNLSGAQAQLQKSISGLSSTIKRTLVPLLILLIAQFGVSAKSKQIQESINNKQCPSPDSLLNIIRRRNKLVNQLNNLYKSIDRLSKILTALTGFLSITKVAFSLIKTNRNTLLASTSTIIPPAIVPGPVISTLFVTKDAQDTLEPKINKAINLIASASFLTLMLAALLKQVIELLKLLDTLIQECSQSQNISLEQLNPDIVAVSQFSNNVYNGEYSYKGFTFEIKEDTKDNNKYVKRYAVAKDTFGVVVLKGESSFSSSTEILIEELKFIIDRDNLKSS